MEYLFGIVGITIVDDTYSAQQAAGIKYIGIRMEHNPCIIISYLYIYIYIYHDRATHQRNSCACISHTRTAD